MSKIKIGDETINFIEINPEYGPILNKKILLFKWINISCYHGITHKKTKYLIFLIINEIITYKQ